MFDENSLYRDDGVDIDTYFSKTRLTDILRVWSPDGHLYRIYQPQTWQYLSVTPEVAEDICRGFPEYWQDSPDEESEPTKDDDRQADSHRNEVIAKLAKHAFPLPEMFRLRESYVREFSFLSKERCEELISWVSANPFAVDLRESELLKEKHQIQYNMHAKGDGGTHSGWRKTATRLFTALALSAQVPRCPSALTGAQTSTTLLPSDVSHQRGSSLTSQQQLEQLYRRSKRRPVQWGPLFYDEATVNRSHFCVTGMTRSGKSTLLRLLFQSLHQSVTPAPRFVFYDAKPDLLPYLFRPLPYLSERTDDDVAQTTYLLSPFDTRGTAWDIAADAANRSTATEIAEILFPASDGHREHEFYGPAVRDVATELMVALTRTAAQKWTFYDFLCAMQLENIQSILCSTPNGRRLYATYLEGKKSNVPEDLVSALRTKSASLLPAAYAWTHAKQRVSVREWVSSQTKSIVLFNDDDHFEENSEINRILLNLLAQRLLAIKNPPARTFLYLDEIEHLGRIEPLKRLVHKGAGLQVNLVISFHSLETLKEVYGEATEGILSQANFAAFLKVRSLATSDWASQLIGTPEVKVKDKSTQRNATPDDSYADDDDDRKESESEHYATRRLVLPDEIRQLPIPADAKALRGYFLAPRHAPYFGTLPESRLIRSATEFLAAEFREDNFYALWPKSNGVSDHCQQPDERYNLPDDQFRTLYELGFRKADYSPPTSTVPPTMEIKEAESPPTDPPPTPPPIQSPVDTGPLITPESTEPPTEEDDDLDYDFKYPD